MERHFNGAMVLLGLACLPGLVSAEPLSNERPEYRVPLLSQGWGDPEDSVESDSGWTWFGMGYEQRTRAADGAGADSGGRGDDGQSKIHRGTGDN